MQAMHAAAMGTFESEFPPAVLLVIVFKKSIGEVVTVYQTSTFIYK